MSQVKDIPLSDIIVPSFIEPRPNRVQDDILRNSIRKSGIQQPLILVPDATGYMLAKGLRRLDRARELGLDSVPAVIEKAPDGITPETHARRLRFVCTFHRQDLLPSQKADLILKLKSEFGMSNMEVASYLGINNDSVTNWLAIRNYIAPVAEAMDRGEVTMHSARAFDGMSEEGQRKIWGAHRSEIESMSGAVVHKFVREKYPPTMFPAYYKDADKAAKRLERKSGKRKAKARANYTPDERKALRTSYEMKELELSERTEELARLEKEIKASVTPIAAILRNKSLLAMVPEEMREELEFFAKSYV